MFPTSKYLTTMSAMKIISCKSLFLFLAYLTCCVWAWPAASPSIYRRNSNANANANANLNFLPFSSSSNGVNYEAAADYPQLPLSDGFNNYNSQWDRAKEPLSYYDLLDDYLNQPVAGTDVETYPNNLADLYDPPVWGKIVKEKPESELEELKAEEREREAEDRQRAEDAARYNQYYSYDYAGHPQKRGQQGEAHPAAAATMVSSPTNSATTTTPEKNSVTSTPPTTNQRPGGSSTLAPKVVKLLHQQPGMKEVPMLRPPYKGKQQVALEHQIDEENVDGDDDEQEPVIAVAQRSVVDKPSAYDKLRKYLSLEDALKKEAEKRKSTSSRLQKRAPAGNKQIVTDVDTLSGQLKNLKKSTI